MVLGLSAKNQRKGPTIHVDYLIHIQEIKPWPPSQSLRSLRSVMIQWENGDRHSGSTNTVVPSIGSVVGEGKIEFNESFKLPVTLVKEISVRGKDADAFQKNWIEFNLYESRRDKTQLLASAIVDLADHGIVKETLNVSAPMNCKRSFRNTDQPVLFIKIQPLEKGRSSSSSRGSLSKERSLDKNGSESVSALMNEEYAEEAESASFTDDDVSSHSSLAASASVVESNGGLVAQTEENASTENPKGSSSCTSSVDLSSDYGSPRRGSASVLSSNSSNSLVPNNQITHSVKFSSSQSGSDSMQEENQISKKSNGDEKFSLEDCEIVVDNGRTGRWNARSKKNTAGSFQASGNGKHSSEESPAISENMDYCSTGNACKENGSESQNIEEDRRSTEDGLLTTSPPETMVNTLKSDTLKNIRSVRSPSDSARSNGVFGLSVDGQQGPGMFRSSERKDTKLYPKDARSAILDNKVQQLEHKIKMLEGELREAAAIEAALYSVVAEHGSSMSKVHAPARRLSRLYLHACKERLSVRRATAARSAVSGLVLVAKACGNDVPRLTFWLSNSVMLRVIISQSVGDTKLSQTAGPTGKINGGIGKKQEPSPFRLKESSSGRKESRSISSRNFHDWEDPSTFTSALERIESWIFSRIIESVWWQTLTPHMQLAAHKNTDQGTSSVSKKDHRWISSSNDQDQGNFSLDHWKKAFRDACERICPVRAGGHECGCLPLLARLIMEQCITRLDVAMFNAILRESGDEIPTDPVSDPISDSTVLPIPPGKTSFGAGAQLKNAIGNWSRWLTDLFGIDDDPLEEENEYNESDERQETSFKSFHLLNALSDLMMLPKDMLLSKSIRTEVCPTFGAPLIKRVLDYFVPDEFCPDPVPDVVLKALESEDPDEAPDESITSFPCAAAPPVYSPPSAASIATIIGEVGGQSQLRRSGSSVLRKSYTSDDELDELNSPLSSILVDGFRSSPVQSQSKLGWISRVNHNQNAIRYELLRDVWLNSE